MESESDPARAGSIAPAMGTTLAKLLLHFARRGNALLNGGTAARDRHS